MTPEIETSELELIAKAFQAISKEVSSGGLADALLKTALGCSGAVRGAVLLSEGGELLAKADASFSRDALYTAKGEGLDLGLSICRKIVDAHGGRLWVEKNTTHGATFTFALPLHRSVQLPANN